MNKRFIVIKEIEQGWQVGAKVGDILTVETWSYYDSEFVMLMNEGKAVCEVDSDYAKEHCIEEGACEIIKQKIRIPMTY